MTVTSNNAAVTLSVNGGTAGSSVTLTSGTQVLEMAYTGAAIGSATLTASASGATNGTATFTPTAAPIQYTYTGPTLPAGDSCPTSSPTICLYAPSGGGTGSSFTFTATQAGYTGTFGNNLSLSGASACSSFATVTQSGTTFTVSAIASPTPGTCNITLGGYGTTTLNVTIDYESFGITVQ